MRKSAKKMMMRLYTIIAPIILVLALISCGQKGSIESLSTLSVESDAAVDEIFSLVKALDLGAGYLGTLEYQNAILQYTEIIAHDPQNKAAYAGLYSAYVALDQTDEAENILKQAQETFEEDDAIVEEILSDADVIYQNGGGNAPYRHLSDWYLKMLEENNSDALRRIGDAWMQAEPGNAAPYAVLGVYYEKLGDQSQLESLVEKAELNGVALNDINAEIETKINGNYIIHMEIETSKNPIKVDVEIQKEDDAQEVVKKVTEEVAQESASQVVEQSGLEGEAADLAQQYAQEAIRQGLSALPGGFGF